MQKLTSLQTTMQAPELSSLVTKRCAFAPVAQNNTRHTSDRDNNGFVVNVFTVLSLISKWLRHYTFKNKLVA